MSFLAVQTALVLDILEVFNTRKFLYPHIGNCPPTGAFPVEDRGERDRRNEKREKEHSNFCKQATMLVSICSPAAVFEVLSENKTLKLGTLATMAYF